MFETKKNRTLELLSVYVCMFHFDDKLHGFQTYIHAYSLIVDSIYGWWDIHTRLVSFIPGLGPIPHGKRSVLNVLFNFSRFVRGGTSGGRRQTCTYVWGVYACMYVSKHVCMFETVNHHPRAGSDSSRKTFSIDRFIQFFKICEGGTSGGPRHTYMLKQNHP